MKHILVPTDFSSAATNALDFAIGLFGPQCRFTLLHCYHDSIGASAPMISLNAILQSASEESLKHQAAAAAKKHQLADGILTTVSLNALPAPAICQFAESHQVVAVVMGTTGAGAVKEFFLGSVSAETIRACKRPLFTVPEACPYRPLKKWLLSADLEPTAANLWRDAIQQFGPSAGLELTVLKVEKPGKSVPSDGVEHGFELYAELLAYNPRFEVVWAEHADAAIANFLQSDAHDLVVAVPRRGHWLKRLLNKSTSKNLSRKLSVPLLCLPE